MVRLWRLYQGGGMGVGYLPEPGGALDQSTLMLEAFGLMSSAEAELKKEDGDGN